MNNDVSNYTGGAIQSVSSESLTDHQKDAVWYFFNRIRALDAGQFKQLCPDEKTESMVKREYAAHIIGLSKYQIDLSFDAYHRERQAHNKEYKFLNIDMLIGLAKNNGKSPSDSAPAGIYKEFEKLALPDKSAQERAEKAGGEVLDGLKGLFDD